MTRYFNNSVSNQLSLLISVCVITIFVIAGLFFYDYTETILLERVKSEALLKSENISDDVNAIFSNAKLATENLSKNVTLKNYIESVHTYNDITTSKYYSDVFNILNTTKHFSDFYATAWVAGDKSSFYLESSGNTSDQKYNISSRPWYPSAANNSEVVFTKPFKDYLSDKTILAAIKSIRNKNGEVFGFATIDIELSTIPEIFKAAKIGNKGKYFLISNDGTFMYHDDETKILKENIFKSTDGLETIANSIFKTDLNFTEVSYKSEDYYAINYKVNTTGWVVISLLNKNEAWSTFNNFFYGMTGIFLIGLSLLIMLITTLIKKQLQPIKVISTYAEEIAAGKFNKTLPSDFIDKKDEMGDMTRAFHKIVDAFINRNKLLDEKIKEKTKEIKDQHNYILKTEKMASLGSLVAGVAHEINTPLGVSITATSYMEKINNINRSKLSEGSMTKGDLQKFMEEMNSSLTMLTLNLNRAAELVKSFKLVAVNQSSETKMFFSLKENIDTIIISLRHEYKKHDYQIVNTCPDSILLESYPGAFSQIFTNFIINSIKHGFKDRDHGRINIDVYLDNQFLKVIYSDDGHGISKQNLEKIYDPFFTTNRQGGNSGLGLNIVFNIVNQKLKGSIRCESSPGNGVKFIIEIPKNIVINRNFENAFQEFKNIHDTKA